MQADPRHYQRVAGRVRHRHEEERRYRKHRLPDDDGRGAMIFVLPTLHHRVPSGVKRGGEDDGKENNGAHAGGYKKLNASMYR